MTLSSMASIQPSQPPLLSLSPQPSKVESPSLIYTSVINDNQILPATNVLHLGLDVGSTTVKLVLLGGANHECLLEYYMRHCFDVKGAVVNAFKRADEFIRDLKEKTKISGPNEDIMVTACVTGSAGMKLADAIQLPFVQGSPSCISVLITLDYRSRCLLSSCNDITER